MNQGRGINFDNSTYRRLRNILQDVSDFIHNKSESYTHSSLPMQVKTEYDGIIQLESTSQKKNWNES